MTKRTRPSLKPAGGEGLNDLLKSSGLGKLDKEEKAPEPTQEAAPVQEAPALAPAPEKPAKAAAAAPKKRRGIDPHKGSTKLDAYASKELVDAVKWLCAEEERSIGFIVRKYLDTDRLLADAREAGFQEEE
ncbi:hypothetical protein ACJJIE_00060 (plasmid) [Microbulbifer sp. TRSA001]|uniref:hypothetical protein n=1 Tax=Microbulbifer sp. TRSA001 TaxID=3243381 RepID=UPI0040395189